MERSLNPMGHATGRLAAPRPGSPCASDDGVHLSIDQVSKTFGGVHAVRNVSLQVKKGELRGIIGPNGAGKSTLLKIIGGQLRQDAGTIRFDGTRLEDLATHARARQGIAVVFQGARLFRGMTVLENVMVGAHSWTRSGFVSSIMRTPRHRNDEKEIRDAARAAVSRVGLENWASSMADMLPLGQQRAMQIARALCGRPRLLLLDEPASGMRKTERDQFADLVHRLRSSGITILLIEHDVALVRSLADRLTVLDLGTVIADGDPDGVLGSENVIRAYTGAAQDD